VSTCIFILYPVCCLHIRAALGYFIWWSCNHPVPKILSTMDIKIVTCVCITMPTEDSYSKSRRFRNKERRQEGHMLTLLFFRSNGKHDHDATRIDETYCFHCPLTISSCIRKQRIFLNGNLQPENKDDVTCASLAATQYLRHANTSPGLDILTSFLSCKALRWCKRFERPT
jgi:hypothetical protein